MKITQRISNLQEAVSDSDIIITITPSHTPLIQKEWVKPGTHFSCIGADMAGKEEIDSQIFEDAIVFVDDLEHCRNAGEIEIPLSRALSLTTKIPTATDSKTARKLTLTEQTLSRLTPMMTDLMTETRSTLKPIL